MTLSKRDLNVFNGDNLTHSKKRNHTEINNSEDVDSQEVTAGKVFSHEFASTNATNVVRSSGSKWQLFVHDVHNLSSSLPTFFRSKSNSTSNGGAKRVLKKWVGLGLKCCIFKAPIMNPSVIDCMKEFNDLDLEHGLLTTYFSNGNRVSSGYHWKRTLGLLKTMKTCRWDLIIKLWENQGFKITNAWLIQYLGRGCHPYHPDKRLSGTHRIICSVGCMGKLFMMKCNNTEIALALRHGSMFILNKETSGNGCWVIGNTSSMIEHGAGGNEEGSIAVVFEVTKA